MYSAKFRRETLGFRLSAFDRWEQRGFSMSFAELHVRLCETRELTLALVAGLSDADSTIQPMPDASPAKWHLGHTTWFFETFILRDHVADYRLYEPSWPFLFNSYYEAEGQRLLRARRGMLSRPSLEEVIAYRRHVDTALASEIAGLPEAAFGLVELGIQHEQQHQELLLTDILNAFASNPTGPAYWPDAEIIECPPAPPLEWHFFEGGLAPIGHSGSGFAFDAETPRHQAMLEPFAIASRCVTNREWEEFIADGGYRDPRHWLSDGWAWVNSEQISAPLYWGEKTGDGRISFTLGGERLLAADAPAAHVSFFEADAFASWAGARLPTEQEWELAASSADPQMGNLLDGRGPIAPRGARGDGIQQIFGDVWEWTGSAFRPYPGFRAAPGAVGEYNGKFMSGQFVLRGGSCATPRGHMRASYRNFFHPHQRWQFSGLRLAKDI